MATYIRQQNRHGSRPHKQLAEMARSPGHIPSSGTSSTLPLVEPVGEDDNPSGVHDEYGGSSEELQAAAGGADAKRPNTDGGKVTSEYATIEIGIEPCHPKIEFPVSDGRHFNYEWFNTHPWLTYDVANDTVRCHTCLTSIKTGLMREQEFRKTAFLRGFSKWKKAGETFKKHEQSEAHTTSMQKIVLSRQQPITAGITEASRKEQRSNTEVFLDVLSTLRGLARCGTALRGHKETDGNLMRMLQDRSAVSPEVKKWLEKKTNFLSHECQDELFEVMATMVQRDIAEEVKKSGWFSVIADGTTDVSRTEQFCVCLRHVDETLCAKEVFCGLYAAPDTSGETLFKIIVDVMRRMAIDIGNLRGMCFDGASNMSGALKGVQARLAQQQPKAVYVHCLNHSLDLALVEEAKAVPIIGDVMNIVRDVSTSLNTAKRRNMFEEHVILGDDSQSTGPGRSKKLLAICPTRWTVRSAAFRRFLDCYDAVMDTVDDIIDDNGTAPDVKARLRGVSIQLQHFETLFAMYLALQIFEPCECLAKTLQKPSLSIGDAIKAANDLVSILDSQRTDQSFSSLFTSVSKRTTELTTEIAPPKAPRVRRPPRRLEQTSQPCPPAELDAKAGLRKQYFNAIDIVSAEVRRRFNQPGVKRLSEMERALLEPGRPLPPESDEVDLSLAPQLWRSWPDISALQSSLQSISLK
ncbi:zinc finger MYM-type protein 1-like isoform X2 [Amphibalanus amphitrite]|uniref:zinc finger MYM-type protein 1-like isoform X2 n=1 Tax=Amphibalanus amphitrite TaxID=1232801 RepID=UPI001C90ECF9|nr:zinc finger MYM-type protein 1-like isoform X2 [Amphibalanus amphitrite]